MTKSYGRLPVGLFWLSTAALLAGGLLLALGGILPFAWWKTLGDALSKDGTLEMLTFERYAAARLPLLIMGPAMLVAGGAMLARRARVMRWLVAGLAWLAEFTRQTWQDLKLLGGFVWQRRPGRVEGAVLALLVVAAVLMRAVFANRAAQYDEVYSYLEFARHSFWQVISDYHVPNNHVLNTLLMRVSTALFGNALWAIRLPAMTAGVLLVPLVYGLGRTMRQRWAGLAAAALVATLPHLVIATTNGRGYPLVSAFTLAIFILGAVVRQHKNRAAWVLLAVCTALGFYSVPVMLYPFGGLWLWLLLTGILGDVEPAYRSRWGWLRYLLGFSLLAGGLTVLLYLPIFSTSGVGTFLSHSNASGKAGWDAFFGALRLTLHEVADTWTFGLPFWAGPAALLGVGLSLIFHPWKESGIPMSLTLAGFVAAALFAQRSLTIERIWLFVLPLLILWGLVGWFSLALWTAQKAPLIRKLVDTSEQRDANELRDTHMLRVPVVLAGISIILCLGWGISFARPYLAEPAQLGDMWSEDVEPVTRFLQANMQDGDVVVVNFMIDARYWYYFEQYHIPQSAIRDIKRHPFRRVYAVVEGNSWWPVDSLLEEFGPDQGFLKMETLREVGQVGTTRVFAVDANFAAERTAFGNLPPEWEKNGEGQ